MANKMYTRAGDSGQTVLIGGQRVSKTNARISCCGTLDELNATIGIVRAQRSLDKDLDVVLGQLQRNIFTLGAIIANPQHAKGGREVQFDAAKETKAIEEVIDTLAQKLPP